MQHRWSRRHAGQRGAASATGFHALDSRNCRHFRHAASSAPASGTTSDPRHPQPPQVAPLTASSALDPRKWHHFRPAPPSAPASGTTDGHQRPRPRQVAPLPTRAPAQPLTGAPPWTPTTGSVREDPRPTSRPVTSTATSPLPLPAPLPRCAGRPAAACTPRPVTTHRTRVSLGDHLGALVGRSDRGRRTTLLPAAGSRLLIEWDNTQRGANHAHSVWRDPTAAFGLDVLARHRAGHR